MTPTPVPGMDYGAPANVVHLSQTGLGVVAMGPAAYTPCPPGTTRQPGGGCVDKSAPIVAPTAVKSPDNTSPGPAAAKTGANMAAKAIDPSVLSVIPGKAEGLIGDLGGLVFGPIGGAVGGAIDKGIQKLTGGGSSTNGSGGCQPGYVRIGSTCIPATTGGGPGSSTDATPGTVTPAEASTGVVGIRLPARVARQTYVCPTYADGKVGILWMNAMSGQVVCLPRGVNGKGFGLVRKNKPRPKPYISRAEHKLLTKIKTVQKNAKKYAMDAGFKCTPKKGG